MFKLMKRLPTLLIFICILYTGYEVVFCDSLYPTALGNTLKLRNSIQNVGGHGFAIGCGLLFGA